MARDMRCMTEIEKRYDWAMKKIFGSEEVPDLDYVFFKRIWFMAYADCMGLHYSLHNEIDRDIRAYFMAEEEAERWFGQWHGGKKDTKAYLPVGVKKKGAEDECGKGQSNNRQIRNK